MKKGKPAISVVIPAFNEEKYLPACLSAFQKQTFGDFELIVVDNNSTDKTAEIAQSFGARVVKEKKQGMIPAREKGFREAKGEIIARTDADTIVTPNWLEVVYNTFKKHPEAVAITGTWLSPPKIILDKLSFIYAYIVAVVLGKLFSGHIYLLGPNMAIRKSTWKKIKVCMDDKLAPEDADLSCHIAEVGKILYLPHLQVIGSIRKITENPIKGFIQYMVIYPMRYIKMLYIHRSNLRQYNS